MTKDYIWWKNATVYQVWPASFKDSNGDGIGDIPGIISELDHIKSLGTDVVWLSPMYDSPQDDMGYDISDYEKIYPKYGTMEDMDNLIKGCRSRGMKMILDLVINHTSSEHEWFKESRSSKTNPKRDWYVWKKPKYDDQGNRHPPNNWGSFFSESAWEYDETTDEYYLHLFAKSQPDLNWENEECRKAIYQTSMVFWYEKGIDGFRIDTAGLYSKDQRFLDSPIVVPDAKYQSSQMYTNNGPRIHEFHKEMFKNVTSKYDAMTVGEMGDAPKEDILKYVSAKEKEMNMIFLFDIVKLGTDPESRYDYSPFSLVDLKEAVRKQSDFTKGTDAWSTIFLENHDQPRSVSRFGNSSSLKNIFKSSKLLAMMQSTISGTLFLYQGQEIGMTNVPRSWDITDYKDIESANAYKSFIERHGITDKKDPKLIKFLDNVNLLARDNGRSPVQWANTKYGGFSTGEPWMKVNENYPEINVESQANDPNSVLTFWQQSLALRKKYIDLFIYGDLEIVDYENTKTFSYYKTFGTTKAFVILNFSDEPVKFESKENLTLLKSNVDDIGDELTALEGRIYLVN